MNGTAADRSRPSEIVRVTLPATLEAGRRARETVRPALHHLRPVRRADLLVLLSELVVAMAGDGRSGESIIVCVSHHGHALAVEIHGPQRGALDPFVAPLLDRLTSTWSIEDGTARFEIELGTSLADHPDEPSLFGRAREGDANARDEIFARYEGFARALTVRFRRTGIAHEDLDQVASIGLVKAIDRFDLSRGVKFTTYAARTIEGELKRDLRDRGWSVRVPRGLQDTGFEVRRTEAELSQRLGRLPTLEELGEEIGLDADDVGRAVLAHRSFDAVSLDAPSGGADDGIAPLERLPDVDASLDLAPEVADLAPALGALSPRDREILRLRFFEDLSQNEIADRVGISQMHVSRLLAKALDTLRTEIGGEPEG